MRYLVAFSVVCLAGCANGPFWENQTRSQTEAPVSVVDELSEQVDRVLDGAGRQEAVRTEVAAPNPRRVAPPPQRPKLTLPPAEKPAPVAQGFGSTVASLGSVAEPGLWLKTPLVSSRQQGKVTAANGKTVEVTLIPIEGPASAGSRISLAALQALGLPITDLPELAVSPL